MKTFHEIKLRKTHRVVMYDNGNIWFKTPEGEHFTSVIELCYVLQKCQEVFKDLPVELKIRTNTNITKDDLSH